MRTMWIVLCGIAAVMGRTPTLEDDTQAESRYFASLPIERKTGNRRALSQSSDLVKTQCLDVKVAYQAANCCTVPSNNVVLNEDTASNPTVLPCSTVKHDYPTQGCCGTPQKLAYLNHDYHISPETVQSIQTMIDDAVNSEPNVYFANYIIGNVFSNQEFELVTGNKSDGSPQVKGGYLRWASNTKMLAGMLAAKAMEEGIWSLEDDVGMYIPELRNDTLTLKQEDCELCDPKHPSRPILVRDILANTMGNLRDAKGFMMEGQTPVADYDAGTQTYWRDYDWLGLVLSAALLAKGYDMTATEYMLENILKPLGMHSTWLPFGQMQPPADAAERMYELRLKDGEGSAWEKDLPPSPSDDQVTSNYFMPKNDSLTLTGMLRSYGAGPVADYAKLMKMFIRGGVSDDGVRVLTEESLEIARTPLTTLWGSGWAFGFMTDQAPMYRWKGFFGTRALWNIENGFYVFGGTQTTNRGDFRMGPTFEIMDVLTAN